MVRILHGEGYSVPQITATLRINRTYGYALLKEYKSKKRERSDEAMLRQKIEELCGEFPTNGYRRIRVWLYKRYQLRVNHKRVYRFMKDLGLLTRSKGRTAKRKKQSGRVLVIGSNQHFQINMTKIWCGRDGWG
ncbi:IS3 family transposase [Thermoactinomyces sp. CICC 10521]|nr:IS3 family transposase [Thermoactinomyces sp. CICC 10521]